MLFRKCKMSGKKNRQGGRKKNSTEAVAAVEGTMGFSYEPEYTSHLKLPPSWVRLLTAITNHDSDSVLIRKLIEEDGVPIHLEILTINYEWLKAQQGDGVGLQPKRRSILFEAVYFQSVNTVKALLELKADANYCLPEGGHESVLMDAIHSQNKPIIKLLLDHDADPALSQPNGTTPLMKALLNDRLDAANFL